MNSQLVHRLYKIRVLDMLQGTAAIQSDLNRLGRWADRNLLKFSKEKCKVLHLDKKTPCATRQAGVWLTMKQLCTKASGDPGWQQTEKESVVCPYKGGNQPHHGLYFENCSQWDGRRDSSSLLNTWKTPVSSIVSSLRFPRIKKTVTYGVEWV